MKNGDWKSRTFCATVVLAKQAAALISLFKKYNIVISTLTLHFARLLVLNPIKDIEDLALDFMNTDAFSRRPKKILNDWETAFCNLMTNLYQI